jgi:hypothetical protein
VPSGRDVGEHDLREREALPREGSRVDLEAEHTLARAQRPDVPPPFRRGARVQVHVLRQAQHDVRRRHRLRAVARARVAAPGEAGKGNDRRRGSGGGEDATTAQGDHRMA